MQTMTFIYLIRFPVIIVNDFNIKVFVRFLLLEHHHLLNRDVVFLCFSGPVNGLYPVGDTTVMFSNFRG